MTRLSRAQEEARRNISELSGRSLLPEELGRRLMRALNIAIPYDGYRLLGTDPTTLLVNRLLAASENDTWARHEWLREVYLASDLMPYIELPNLMRMGLTAVAYQEQQDRCWGYPPDALGQLDGHKHQEAFHALRSPVGGTVLANFAADGQWVAALQLYRRDTSSPFRRGDIAFLRLLAPTIGRAIACAIAREQALANAECHSPDAAGILIIGGDGRVQFSTPSGEAWSRLLHDAQRTGDDALPTAVASAVAGLRSNGHSASAVLAQSRSGPVRIEASPSGREGEVAVVLSPRHAPSPPQLPAHWPLTAQERQIVAHVTHGQSNARIADRLSISQNTVQTHLRHVYEKLNVGSRTQLMAAFFRETYWPGFKDDEADHLA